METFPKSLYLSGKKNPKQTKTNKIKQN